MADKLPARSRVQRPVAPSSRRRTAQPRGRTPNDSRPARFNLLFGQVVAIEKDGRTWLEVL